jgi:5-methylcytosine-specific restriction endonuclease McrA
MPSSKSYKRDYQQEYATESPERRRNRAKRNQARQEFIKEGKVHVGDKTAIDHKVPLSKGGGTSLSNLRIRSFKSNSSYHRTKTGAMKYKDQH